MERTQLLSLTQEELADFLRPLDPAPFRVKQVGKWLARGASIAEMTDLPAALRARLAECAVADPVLIRESFRSKLDDTQKLLYELTDGNLIEGVVMRYHYGDTLCLSTQVGCRMGCRFCASTLEGRVRDLTAGEMLGQVTAVKPHARPGRAARPQHRADGQRRTAGQLRKHGEVSAPGQFPGAHEHLPAQHIALHLRPRAADARSCQRGPAGDALHLPARPQRRGAQTSFCPWPTPTPSRTCFPPPANMSKRPAAASFLNTRWSRASIAICATPTNWQRACAVCAATSTSSPSTAVRERDLHPPTRADVQNFLRRLEARHISATVRREWARTSRAPAANCAAACWKTARSDNDGKQRSAP